MPRNSDFDYVQDLVDQLGLLPEQHISALLAALAEEEESETEEHETE